MNQKRFTVFLVLTTSIFGGRKKKLFSTNFPKNISRFILDLSQLTVRADFDRFFRPYNGVEKIPRKIYVQTLKLEN